MRLTTTTTPGPRPVITAHLLDRTSSIRTLCGRGTSSPPISTDSDLRTFAETHGMQTCGLCEQHQ